MSSFFRGVITDHVTMPTTASAKKSNNDDGQASLLNNPMVRACVEARGSVAKMLSLACTFCEVFPEGGVGGCCPG